MRLPFLIAPLAAGLSLGAGFAVAQAPEPKLPATPSMDQKGADDLSKPAGAEKPVAAAPKAPAKADVKAPPAAKQGAAAKPPSPKPHVSSPPRAKRAPAPKTRVPRKKK